MASGSGSDAHYHSALEQDAEDLLLWLYYNAPANWTSHANYEHFTRALSELAVQHGYIADEGNFAYGSAFHVSAQIVRAGGDPEQIKALFTLMFK